MNESTWIDYVTAVGAVAMPIIVSTLAAIGWKLKSRLERRNTLEDKLSDDRIRNYNQILEPFTILLTSDAAWKSEPKN